MYEKKSIVSFGEHEYYTYIMLAFETVVPTYAAELSDTDLSSSDDSDSDIEFESSWNQDEPCNDDIPHPCTNKTDTSDDSEKDSREENESESDDESESDSDAESESESDSDAESESESESESNTKEEHPRKRQCVSKAELEERWLGALANDYATMINQQIAAKPWLNKSQLVDQALKKLTYELNTGKSWQLGIGRAKSFYQYMCNRLKTTSKKDFQMTRKKMCAVMHRTYALLDDSP